MPVYEFECRECGHRFEELVFSSSQPACPSCRGENLQKLLSAFAVGRGSPERAAPGAPCASCPQRGPGGCDIN